MDKKKENLKLQEAPLKNTDKAFVKVDKDGLPAMPGTKPRKMEKRSLRIAHPSKSGHIKSM